MDIGQAIRRLRREKGMRQRQLAAAAGLSHSGLQKIEYGDAEPSMSALLRISSALGVDPAVLFDPAFQHIRKEGNSLSIRTGDGSNNANRLAALSAQCRAAAQEILRLRGSDYVGGKASQAAEDLMEAAVLLRQLAQVLDLPPTTGGDCG